MNSTNRRQDIGRYWPGIFILLLIVWLTAVAWVPWLTRQVMASSSQCPSGLSVSGSTQESTSLSESCLNYLSSVGVTGDLFGAVNALFSGLALFAVALTLQNDIRARREDKKPLLVCEFGEDCVTLQNPHFDDPKSIKIRLKSTIINIGDPAINVSVQFDILTPTQLIYSISEPLIVPLTSQIGKPIDRVVSISNDELKNLLASLGSTDQKTELRVSMMYSSLQKAKWSTVATYILRMEGVGNRNRVLAILDNDRVKSEEEWEGGATIALIVELKPETWNYELNL